MTNGECTRMSDADARSVTDPTRPRDDDRPGVTTACPVCDHIMPAGEADPLKPCPACGGSVRLVAFDGGDEADDTDSYVYEPAVADPPSHTNQEFGRQGWLLVAAVFLAFLVIPVVIYLNAANVIALPFRLAFLALPMIPAVALAALAVWVTTTE